MAHVIGERVGAVLSVADGYVNLLGYGEYLGDLISPDFWIPNPCIKLDNGRYVWGYQCWWGTEDKMRKQIDIWVETNGLEIKEVEIEDRAPKNPET